MCNKKISLKLADCHEKKGQKPMLFEKRYLLVRNSVVLNSKELNMLLSLAYLTS